jgi:hypothetical protein
MSKKNGLKNVMCEGGDTYRGGGFASIHLCKFLLLKTVIFI